MEINETWRPIEGHPQYEVSNLGRVRSYKGNEPRILKPCLTDKGYCRITLMTNGVKKNYRIHRLVAEAFIPNPQNLPHINHKDEDKTNNAISNLEWCDIAYNNNYGTRNARICKPVAQYTKDGALVEKFSSVKEAGQVTGVLCQNISNCANGRIKSAGGYIWKFN